MMATYILLSTLTYEGRTTLKDRPERLNEVNAEIEQMGARVVRQFATLGRYDFVNVLEAPDNETITNVAVELGARGTVHLTTLVAFPVERGRRLSLPFGKGEQFVVFTKLAQTGQRALSVAPDRLATVDAEVERLGGAIEAQYRVLGEYDIVSFVRAKDNDAAWRIANEVSGLGSIDLEVCPAIEVDRFVELLRIRAYRTEPHRWQTQPWADAMRRVYWLSMRRKITSFCRPLTTEGEEHLDRLTGAALIIANHSSHFDTPVALLSLPGRVRSRTTVAAAADRFYRTNQRTWWFSLMWNAFPIARGGGKKALDYPMSLLQRGWSILIYPEGGRKSKPGRVQRFHHGATIMAMQAGVPVVPLYMQGLESIMPRGQRSPTPGPVNVKIGEPVSLDGVESVPDGTRRLEQAMRTLAGADVRVG